MDKVRKDKWAVCGELGGTFTNLADARKCAKEASKSKEHAYIAWVELIEDGCNYFTYECGKLIRDGWTRREYD